jgi:hypothetical protein
VVPPSGVRYDARSDAVQKRALSALLSISAHSWRMLRAILAQPRLSAAFVFAFVLNNEEFSVG